MRELVRGMCSDWAVSIRQACGAIGFDRSTFHYQSRRTDQAAVAKRIREICETRVRYGYRRVHVLLDREGWGINVKKVYRIYKELGMQLRHKTPKRRVKAKLRDDRAVAVGPNDVWAMDFVHDQLATGKKLRVLTVVDTFSRYVPVLDVRYSYRGEDVVATLDRVCRTAAIPRRSASTKAASSSRATWTSGPTSAASCSTSHARQADGQRLHRGIQRPVPSGMPEPALVPDPCGRGREGPRSEKLEAWRRYYNEERPHGAIGNKVPIMLTKSGGVTSPSP
jgi:putative transposase